MYRRLLLPALTVTLLAVTTFAFLSATAAGQTVIKQRVMMKVNSPPGSAAGTFVLTAQGTGPLKSDTGTVKDAVAQKHIVRAGKPVIVFTITSTWTGKLGTMVRERIDDVADKNGNRVGSGVWSLLTPRATHQYVGLSGNGQSAYVLTPHGCCVIFHYNGFVVTKP